jgi:heat shock protein HslJ
VNVHQDFMKRLWLSVSIMAIAVVFAWEASGRGELMSSNGLTGVEWQVSELAGHAVVPGVDRQQPFIFFDAEKKQVTGYSGCNRFFGAYELEGSTLKFGPIGATKRACPDREEGIEAAFFKALDATRRWEVTDGMLKLLNDGHVLARLQKMQRP